MTLLHDAAPGCSGKRCDKHICPWSWRTPGWLCARRWPKRVPPGLAWSRPPTPSAGAWSGDLHDGAQQRLVAIGMSLRLAQQRADPADPMQEVLAGAVGDLQEAVAELRRLAGGVRPRGLDEGLPAAIRGLVRGSPVPVEVQVTADPVPDAVATTAYYVAAEALANALKHGQAGSAVIDVRHRNGDLRVVVSDDGRGGAAVRPGSGLAGLRDRVAAIGGELTVESSPGAGTRVEARLPCGS